MNEMIIFILIDYQTSPAVVQDAGDEVMNKIILLLTLICSF